MKTNKDVIFLICCIVWLLSNVICYMFISENAGSISNLSCIGLFGLLTLVKCKYKKFGLWLEKPIKNKVNGK